MFKKNIKEILDTDYDIDVYGITNDSRKVMTGYIYVATKGFNVDHYDYIDDAIKNGCSIVISDRSINYDIPNIIVDDINNKYYEYCCKFYDVILDDYSFIGITGTDGKTTTSTIVKRIMNDVRKSTYIGTNGCEIDNIKFGVNNTTPCIEELYEILSKSREYKVNNVVMEVSSEALLHDRVKGFKYDVVGFTNICEDHLNVHKTLDNYIECKMRLLNHLKDDGVCIVNGDDKICKNIVSNNVIKFGFDLSNDCIIKNNRLVEKNNLFDIEYLGNTYSIISPFVGIYNIYNVTMAFLICLHSGLSPEYIVDKISRLDVVDGRREVLSFGQDFEIILDYAHTLNGIISIIDSVPKCRKTIIVTGCAGGREKDKRKLIGNYILDNSDIAIFTMDDPRYESVDDIIDQMVDGSDKDYIRIVDRVEAIHKAFSLADKDTTVLILGKGRDNYMAIENKKIDYCDYDVIKKYFDK